MKKFTITISILFLIIFCLISIIVTNNNNNYSSIYCYSEGEVGNMKIYFDFRDGTVYRYTIVTENPITSTINKELMENQVDENNKKYKGYISKIWFDNQNYTTIDIYDLDILTEDEMKELTNISIKEMKKQSRKEIIDSVLPMSALKHTCK